jgi:hypothetical protein
MALLMSGVMSLVLRVSAHSGALNTLLSHWFADWYLSFWVAFPSTLLITPLVKKLSVLFVEQRF